MAVLAIVCGIGSWVALPLVAAIAGAIIGKMEMTKIDRGESPAAGRSLAQIGYWASIANIVLSLLAGIGFCCFFFVIAGGAAATGM